MNSRPVRYIAPLIAFLSLATAHAEEVRVILPFQPGADRSGTLERVEPEAPAPGMSVADICLLIAGSADKHDIPRSYFARLIWQESRFDSNAVSPVGAEGIAQFMPATALRRGLRNAFDPREAIPASAEYLAFLRSMFGNLGLAAAAYNSGEERVARWIDKGGNLPLETENYVLSILGKPVESFRKSASDEPQKPLSDEKSFEEACRALPTKPASGTLLVRAPKPAWGAQVAGHFDRSVVMRKWSQIRIRHAAIVGESRPAVFTMPSAMGRKPLHVIQIGASNRREAGDICNRLRVAGGACVVVKN
ncbi:lytic transglycosylase domain-containing protein [Oricola cellulosilytica]|uniref:Lytic transglycosylase domain-containing protein n=1 Tax=Oricola cellulosilytica TaxID=1429082 RepID=A0A4R0PEF5_9HYPH|nr:lytic transglycosylase domain-containing protein [Oricola cellulosilytica]TCD15971.1 lytic transglycosylase domain-containing protein [Oricola cellulosilytica]